jgi:hypothetical protein
LEGFQFLRAKRLAPDIRGILSIRGGRRHSAGAELHESHRLRRQVAGVARVRAYGWRPYQLKYPVELKRVGPAVQAAASGAGGREPPNLLLLVVLFSSRAVRLIARNAAPAAQTDTGGLEPLRENATDAYSKQFHARRSRIATA